MVVAYVDNQDLVWRKTFVDYCSKNRLQEKIVELLGSRYGGINFINYQLKLINKNMPWINKIYLLLSNKEQAPKDLPSNVEIVLHEQFIPYQFLPTFNSTTIEMFLWNIKGLSEHFIYANDDMLPIGKLEPSDFFEDDKIKISWRERPFMPNVNVYGYQCYNCCKAIRQKVSLEMPKETIIRPLHSFTPMIRSHCKEMFNLCKDLILPHIRAFRTQYQYNQYIYPLYERYKYGSLESPIDFLYTELDKDFDFNHQIICVNCEKKPEYVAQFLKGIKQLCE